MVSDRKRTANRTNARTSTGPKTTGGKAASSKNSLKHGLSRIYGVSEDVDEEINSIARNFAPESSGVQVVGAAREIARWQLELKRIRLHRNRLFAQAVKDRAFETKRGAHQLHALIKILSHRDSYRQEGHKPGRLTLSDIEKAFGAAPLERLHKPTAVLIELAGRLRAIHRYELRAITKRDSAIRKFDAAVAHDLRIRGDKVSVES